jgi:hypothetical protein
MAEGPDPGKKAGPRPPALLLTLFPRGSNATFPSARTIIESFNACDLNRLSYCTEGHLRFDRNDPRVVAGKRSARARLKPAPARAWTSIS